MYALNLTADGAVSQSEAAARKQRILHLCVEGLKNDIHCNSRGNTSLLIIGNCIAAPAEK